MISMVIRFVVSALVLMLVAWLTPGVAVAGFWGALFASIVIAILGYFAQQLLGRAASPTSRGFASFLSAAVVIYLTSWLFPGWLQVSFIGALLASLIIGLIDSVVPTAIR